MREIIKKYYPQLLLLILAFTFFSRVYNLHKPEGYAFDEVYHAVTAKLIAKNDIRAYEWNNPPPEPNTAVDWLHPPYAKYTQAISMNLLGVTSFGWRFSSVIFGVLVILLVAKLAEELFESKEVALLAALITSMDGLVLTMSRIAMNDIHVTTFILLALTAYVRFVKKGRSSMKDFLLTGLAAGLAIGTKWSGLFVILIIGFFETIYMFKDLFNRYDIISIRIRLLNFVKRGFSIFLILIAIPSLVYVASYSHMFMLGKDLNHLKEMHKQIWWYQTNLDATHPAQSKPLQWFLNTKSVWIAVDHSQKGMRGDIYAVGNPAIFWIGDFFIFISLGYLIHLAIKQRKTKKTSKSLQSMTFLIFSYAAIWLPWQLSPRIMFFYHYLPAVPLLSINLAFWVHKLLTHKETETVLINETIRATLSPLNRIKSISIQDNFIVHEKTKAITYTLGMVILLTIIVTFIFWYPHWTNIPVPMEYKDKLYFALEGWKQG